MALTLASNVGALNARHNLNRSSSQLNKSIERLASGLKINRGADGPAALVISEKQRAQIAGLRQAIDNTEKGASVIQTAEGALNEINSLLVKVRGLALDSANTGANEDDALSANQAEIDNALETINRIANNTQFASKKLLDGTAGTTGVSNDSDITFLTASADAKTGIYGIEITTAATKATVTGVGTDPLALDEVLTINGVNISLEATMTQADVIDRINEFSSQTGVTADNGGGGGETRLVSNEIGSAGSILVVSSEAPGVDTSGFSNVPGVPVTGTDIIGTIGGNAATGVGDVLTGTAGDSNGVSIKAGLADATTTVTGTQGNVVITKNALTFQIGANQNQTASISISKMDSASLGNGVSGNQFLSLADVEVTSAEKAQDALGIIDEAISNVANLRGELGAFQQNTLESTANNLRATLENTINAESVIRDTDFAEEIENFTRQQVLVQAGTSVLSNANQSAQLVLSLLG